MKKEHIEHLVTSFKDFKGLEHPMVLVAISRELPTTYKEMHPTEDLGDDVDEVGKSKVHTIVTMYDDWDCEDLGEVTKALHLGVAICNPEDKEKFSERTGIAKATHRARNSNPVMYVSKNGYINSEMVKAFLKQEAAHIQNNPGCVIKGYDDCCDKYKANLDLQETYNKLSEEDKNIVKILANLTDNRLSELQKLVKAHNELSE